MLPAAHRAAGGIRLNSTPFVAASLAIALVFALVPSATAWNHDELPTLASGGGAGAGWVSFKFSTDGSIVAFEANAYGLAGSAQAAGYLFDANDALIFGFTFTSIAFPSEGTYLDVTTPPTGNLQMDTRAPTPGGGSMGVGMTLNDPEFGAGTPGTYKLLLWVAGDATSWDWHARGPAGVALLGQESGANAFLYDAEDFRGAAFAQHQQDGAGGRAAVAANKVVEVENRLFGVFYDAQFKIVCAAVACAAGPGTSAMSVVEPGGATRACGPAGVFVSPFFCGWQGGASGRYTFSLSGADAWATEAAVFVCQPAPIIGGACVVALPWPDSIILGGADAKLPA